MEEVSLIICCYNSRDRLQETLLHVASLDVDGCETELIIVDNASTDDTRQYADNMWHSIVSRKINRFKIVSETNPGLNNARKRGVIEAAYNYIIFIDDDNWLEPDYIKQSFRVFQEYPSAAVIGGLGIPYFESEIKPGWFDKYQGFYAVGKQAEKEGIVTRNRGYVFGASSVWKKDVLNEIVKQTFVVSDRTGIKLSSGGDNEMCYKAIILGYDIVYSSKLKFTHFIPKTRLNLKYINQIANDSLYGYVLLHGLIYKANIHPNMFDTKIKRSWIGQILSSFKNFATGKLSFKHFCKYVMILISLNRDYNRLF